MIRIRPHTRRAIDTISRQRRWTIAETIDAAVDALKQQQKTAPAPTSGKVTAATAQ